MQAGMGSGSNERVEGVGETGCILVLISQAAPKAPLPRHIQYEQKQCVLSLQTWLPDHSWRRSHGSKVPAVGPVLAAGRAPVWLEWRK